MDLPSGFEILTSPWTGVGTLTQIVLSFQVLAVLLGLIPQLRRRLQLNPWFVSITVGPPLFWILCVTSVELLFTLDNFFHHSLESVFRWLLNVPVIIGATLLLQCLLSWQYARGPSRSLPIVGVVFGLLSILSDVVFLLCLITPFQ